MTALSPRACRKRGNEKKPTRHVNRMAVRRRRYIAGASQVRRGRVALNTTLKQRWKRSLVDRELQPSNATICVAQWRQRPTEMSRRSKASRRRASACGAVAAVSAAAGSTAAAAAAASWAPSGCTLWSRLPWGRWPHSASLMPGGCCSCQKWPPRYMHCCNMLASAQLAASRGGAHGRLLRRAHKLCSTLMTRCVVRQEPWLLAGPSAMVLY